MTNKRKKELRFEAAFMIVQAEERLRETLPAREGAELGEDATNEEIEYAVASLHKLFGSAYNRAAKQYTATGGTLS